MSHRRQRQDAPRGAVTPCVLSQGIITEPTPRRLCSGCCFCARQLHRPQVVRCLPSHPAAAGGVLHTGQRIAAGSGLRQPRSDERDLPGHCKMRCLQHQGGAAVVGHPCKAPQAHRRLRRLRGSLLRRSQVRRSRTRLPTLVSIITSSHHACLPLAAAVRGRGCETAEPHAEAGSTSGGCSAKRSIFALSLTAATAPSGTGSATPTTPTTSILPSCCWPCPQTRTTVAQC